MVEDLSQTMAGEVGGAISRLGGLGQVVSCSFAVFHRKCVNADDLYSQPSASGHQIVQRISEERSFFKWTVQDVLAVHGEGEGVVSDSDGSLKVLVDLDRERIYLGGQLHRQSRNEEVRIFSENVEATLRVNAFLGDRNDFSGAEVADDLQQDSGVVTLDEAEREMVFD